MRKTIETIAALTLLTATPVFAQDFYDGCRGPKAVQIDMYATQTNNNTNGLVIPKVFMRNVNESLPDLVIAAPYSISDKENKGLNVGLMRNEQQWCLTGALGLFKDGNGNYNILNPQLYATVMQGPWTVDITANIPHNLKTHNTGSFLAGTIGYGLTDKLRVGGSASKAKGKDVHYQALMRLDVVTEKTVHFLEGYLGKDKVGVRWAINY